MYVCNMDYVRKHDVTSDTRKYDANSAVMGLHHLPSVGGEQKMDAVVLQLDLLAQVRVNLLPYFRGAI